MAILVLMCATLLFMLPSGAAPELNEIEEQSPSFWFSV